jgi:phosphoribosylanthranilate isomerase
MVKIKICGLTSVSDAGAALRFGADFVGFIVDVPVETPRKITYLQAADFVQQVDRHSVVFVLMPSSVQEVERALSLKPFGIQFHGNETPEFMKEVRNIAGKTRLIKVLHVKKGSNFKELKEATDSYSQYVDFLLLDTQTDKAGGTGETHDWNIARRLVEAVKTPIFLSGGLNPENACEAINKVRPYALDASSGLEGRPGFKDMGKLRRFVEEVRRCST